MVRVGPSTCRSLVHLMQYTEDGLLSVDENREGHAAAFGDDIAIECLATEFKREIYVVSSKHNSVS